MRIDSIARLPRTRRHEIEAGGAVVLTLSTETLQLAGLGVGDELTEGDVARLRYQDDRSRALTSALAAIARRPHSEAELRDKLRRKGFGHVLIDEVLGRMRELGYVNDSAFAQFWTETRQAAAPRLPPDAALGAGEEGHQRRGHQHRHRAPGRCRLRLPHRHAARPRTGPRR